MDPVLFKKLQEGRKKYQDQRTKDVVRLTNKLFKDGKRDVGKLTKRDLFMAGVALYWAEGFKHKDESGLGLGTSDPNMAKFYISWLERCLEVSKKDLLFRVTANESHKDRIGEIEKFWMKELGVEKEQFAKPFYQKTKWKKVYLNRGEYFGVLRIRVRRSLNLLRKMRGWLAGMAEL
ncbi:hypothetical protein KJ953_03455 [Patescibacteria group bacterium]|nr:hypothetical protein [Patescibacteria group bacterium]